MESSSNTKQNVHFSPLTIIAVCVLGSFLVGSFLIQEKESLFNWRVFAGLLLFGSFLSALIIIIFNSESKKAIFSSFPKEINKKEKDGRQEGFLIEKNKTLEDLSIRQKKTIQDLEKSLSDKDHQLLDFTAQLEKNSERTLFIEKEKKDLIQKNQDLKEQIKHSHSETQTEMEKKNALLSEYKRTLAEQRGIIEKKQKQIQILESKVSDLTYEVKTLIQLEDIQTPASLGKSQALQSVLPSTEFDQLDIDELYESLPLSLDSNSPSEFEANMRLNRVIQMAMKLTSPQHLQGRFLTPLKTFSSENYVLDFRRLFDKIEMESNHLILVLSPQKKTVIFVNQYVRKFLGWSPEKFTKDFKNLTDKGLETWENLFYEMKTSSNKDFRMILKTKSQNEILARCYVQKIPQGLFKDYMVGLLTCT